MYWLPVIHNAANSANSANSKIGNYGNMAMNSINGNSGAAAQKESISDSPFSPSLSSSYNLKNPTPKKVLTPKSPSLGHKMEILSPSLMREQDSPVFMFPDATVGSRRSLDRDLCPDVTFCHHELFTEGVELDEGKKAETAAIEYKGRVMGRSKTKRQNGATAPAQNNARY